MEWGGHVLECGRTWTSRGLFSASVARFSPRCSQPWSSLAPEPEEDPRLGRLSPPSHRELAHEEDGSNCRCVWRNLDGRRKCFKQRRSRFARWFFTGTVTGEVSGVRNRKGLPPLHVQEILMWANDYHRRTGDWPNRNCGSISNALPNPGWQWTWPGGMVSAGFPEALPWPSCW